jgi:hypothetical protein
MIHRTLVGAALIGLVGLPYVLSTQKGDRGPESGPPDELLAAAPPPGARLDLPPRLPATPAAARPAGNQPGQAARAAARPPAGLQEIFNFHLTPERIIHSWPMVTTTTNQPELKGYRVPLVTGGRPDSLAGSLTYYFDKDQKLQRIVFHGTTGEPRPLVQLMTQKFDFKPEPVADANLQRYQVRWSGRVVSELRVQPAQVVDAKEPLRRFGVNLLIERPQKIPWFNGTTSGLGSLRL